MLAHHIVVQRKLIENCAQRFVSNAHFSKLLLFCTYQSFSILINLCCTTLWCATMLCLPWRTPEVGRTKELGTAVKNLISVIYSYSSLCIINIKEKRNDWVLASANMKEDVEFSRPIS